MSIRYPRTLVVVILLSGLLDMGQARAGDSFLYGVSNAAFQVEGHPADSDFNRWSRVPGHTKDGTNVDVVTDFWNQYDQDFELTQKMGANAFRMSIPWERIEPKKGQWDMQALDHYVQMIAAMRKRGIEPVVTLHHFTSPVWLKDGVLTKGFDQDFAAYAKVVAQKLSAPPASVRYWVTFNEPTNLASGGYDSGWWPPEYKGGRAGYFKALDAMAKAHLAAYQAIKQINPKAQISVAQVWPAILPKTSSPQDLAATKRAEWDKIGYFIDHLKEPNGKLALDYMGINYYVRFFAQASNAPEGYHLGGGKCPQNDLYWEVCGKNLEDALVDAGKYGLPVMITESGAADAQDRTRSKLLEDEFVAMKRAQARGVNLIGYMHWSLTDNWEWGEGESAKFGLVAVDYRTLKRTPRPAYYTYQRLIREAKAGQAATSTPKAAGGARATP